MSRNISQVEDNAEDGLVSVVDLVAILAAGRWLILLFVLLGGAGGVFYGMVTPKTYLVEVKMTDPDADRSAGLGQLGGVAALVTGAMTTGGESLRNRAVLQSRPFITSVIRNRNLLPILFDERWDADRKAWLPSRPSLLQRIGVAEPPSRLPPTLTDGYDELISNMDVEGEPTSGVVTLKLEGRDPVATANIANWLVYDLNRQVNRRKRLRSERSVQFLQMELRSADVLETRARVTRLIEDELTRQAVLAGEQESAFRVIEPAVPPKKPASPRRLLGIFVGILLGAMLGITLALLRPVVRSIRHRLALAQP